MIKYLEWDSDFFGYSVGNYTAESPEDIECLPELLKQNEGNFKLIYLNTQNNLFISHKKISSFEVTPVGEKALFQKTNLTRSDIRTGHFDTRQTIVTENLRKLALTSGEFSRYNCDPSFVNHEYERLYLKWIENSINGTFADEIVISKDDAEEAGMITYSTKNGICTIGLFAVLENRQNKGIGSNLLKYVENKCVSSGIKILQVQTQAENTKACKFYERYGFKAILIQNIYHLWNKK